MVDIHQATKRSTPSGVRRRACSIVRAAAFLVAGCTQVAPHDHQATAGSGPIEVERHEAIDLAEVTDMESLPVSHHALVDLQAVGHDLVVDEGEPDFEDALELRRIIDDATITPPEAVIDKAVVGKEDSRVPVTNTRVAPYSAVVDLAIKFLKHGDSGRCTGTMIAADAVLTAAHCVFNSEKSLTGYAYSVTVAPALYPKDPVPRSGRLHRSKPARGMKIARGRPTDAAIARTAGSRSASRAVKSWHSRSAWRARRRTSRAT